MGVKLGHSTRRESIDSGCETGRSCGGDWEGYCTVLSGGNVSAFRGMH